MISNSSQQTGAQNINDKLLHDMKNVPPSHIYVNTKKDFMPFVGRVAEIINDTNTNTISKAEFGEAMKMLLETLVGLHNNVTHVQSEIADNRVENATIKVDMAKIKSQVQKNSGEIRHIKKKGITKGQALNIYITISTVTSVCVSILLLLRTYVRHKNFFSLKSPWNHPLTPGVDPWG